MNEQTGVFRRQVAEFNVQDGALANVLVRAMIVEGYDVDSKMAKDSNGLYVGETLTVHHKEIR